MEDIDKEFVSRVKSGDIMVGGWNLVVVVAENTHLLL